MRAFYPVLGAMELSAELGYTTNHGAQEPMHDHFSTIELFRNKRYGKLSSQKAMEGANQWVYSSETAVR